MISPGATLRADGTLPVTIGAGQAANFVNEGIGFMNNGSVAIDTNAPSGGLSDRGYSINSTGALFGTTVVSGTDLFIEGVRVTTLGQVVYVLAIPTQFVNGNPVGAQGELAVS